MSKLFLLFALLLSSCGGKGGDSTSNPEEFLDVYSKDVKWGETEISYFIRELDRNHLFGRAFEKGVIYIESTVVGGKISYEFYLRPYEKNYVEQTPSKYLLEIFGLNGNLIYYRPPYNITEKMKSLGLNLNDMALNLKGGDEKCDFLGCIFIKSLKEGETEISMTDPSKEASYMMREIYTFEEYKTNGEIAKVYNQMSVTAFTIDHNQARRFSNILDVVYESGILCFLDIYRTLNCSNFDTHKNSHVVDGLSTLDVYTQTKDGETLSHTDIYSTELTSLGLPSLQKIYDLSRYKIEDNASYDVMAMFPVEGGVCYHQHFKVVCISKNEYKAGQAKSKYTPMNKTKIDLSDQYIKVNSVKKEGNMVTVCGHPTFLTPYENESEVSKMSIFKEMCKTYDLTKSGSTSNVDGNGDWKSE